MKIMTIIFLVSFLWIIPILVLAQESEQALSDSERILNLEKKIERLTYKIEDLEDRIGDVENEYDELTALNISGFFDVGVSNYKNKPNIFDIGFFELDIKHDYKNNFQVAAALVFDDDEGTYLGVGFINYSLYGKAIAPRGRLFFDDGLHIQIGKFDVPLGNDWKHVSPVDRLTVTPPLTTENLMEGVYNDTGMRLLFNYVAINASLYMTQGVEGTRSYGGNTVGIRLGLTPFSNPFSLTRQKFSNFELGVSYLYDTDRDGEESENIVAFDYESQTGPLIIRAEYYKRSKAIGVEQDGYHTMIGLDFEKMELFPVTMYCRYGSYNEKNNIASSTEESTAAIISSDEYLTRVTAGMNFNISNISYLKFEYQNYIHSSEGFTKSVYYSKELYYMQLVITF